METLINFLQFALPGGFIGSVFTWLVGRRRQDNDMLSQLQASINMLSEENRKILQENVQLRRENANLQANQEEMLQKLASLTKEVERLRKEIKKRGENDEKANQMARAASAIAAPAADDNRLRNGKEKRPNRERKDGEKVRQRDGDSRERSEQEPAPDSGGHDGADNASAAEGVDTDVEGGGGDATAEP